MNESLLVRPIQPFDYAAWRSLWDGYNTFYGRAGTTTLPEQITESLWERLFSANELIHAFVALHEGRIVGLTHYLFHRSTTRLNDVCYVQDLFTDESLRGKGIGRQLILAVYDAAREAGCSRVYWHTHTSNTPGRTLYDKVGDHQGFIVYTHEL